MAGVLGGFKIKRDWSDFSKTLSWFEAKGKIEDIYNKLNISIVWTKCYLSQYKTFLHPYRSAEIKLLNNNLLIGVFGQINPILAKNYNLPMNLFLFEFDIDILQNELEQETISTYNNYSLYPKITKDISFIVSKTITFEEIQKTLLNYKNESLKSIELLDEYKGDTIPKNCTSFCIQLIFQSTQKTLLNKDIDEIVQTLQDLLLSKHKIILRV